MLTAHGNEDITAESTTRSAFDYISKKNLNVELLEKSIRGAIDKITSTKQLKEQEAKIEQITYHDPLTGLPNKLLFEYTLTKTLDIVKNQKTLLAVLLLEIDRIKNINTALGYEAGDILFKQIVTQLQTVLQNKEALARFSGDQFVILATKINKKEDAGLIAEKILHAFEKPFLVGSKKIHVDISIGIATYPVSGDTALDLMRRADSAIQQAKHAGRNNFQFYLPEFDKNAIEHYQIEHALHDAFYNQELYLMYQPIYSLANNALFGIEPLVCWKHPEFGKTPTEKIIAAAEECGLIVPINNWATNEIMRVYQDCKTKGAPPAALVIPLSARQFNAMNWFFAMQQSMEKYQIDSRNIIFELHQSRAITAPTIHTALSPAIDAGVQFFIDDIDMSSAFVSLMNAVTLSGLKIRKALIQNIEDNAKDRNFLKMLFNFAQSMGFSAIIEGIETKAQIDFLKIFTEGKCPTYYISKPLALEAMQKLMLGFGTTK